MAPAGTLFASEGATLGRMKVRDSTDCQPEKISILRGTEVFYSCLLIYILYMGYTYLYLINGIYGDLAVTALQENHQPYPLLLVAQVVCCLSRSDSFFLLPRACEKSCSVFFCFFKS